MEEEEKEEEEKEEDEEEEEEDQHHQDPMLPEGSQAMAHTDRQTDIATYRLNHLFSENKPKGRGINKGRGESTVGRERKKS